MYHNYKPLAHSIFSQVFPSHFQKYITEIIIKKKNALILLIVHTKTKCIFGETYLWLSSNPLHPPDLYNLTVMPRIIYFAQFRHVQKQLSNILPKNIP